MVAPRVLRNRFVEPAVTVGTAIAAEPVNILAGLLQLDDSGVVQGNRLLELFGLEPYEGPATPSQALRRMEEVGEQFTYSPRTPQGQADLQSLKDTVVKVMDAVGVDEAITAFNETVVPKLNEAFGEEATKEIGSAILMSAPFARRVIKRGPNMGDTSEAQAMATYEQTPGAGINHLGQIINAPFEERQAFDRAATWENQQGLDSIYTEGGLGAEETRAMVGAYTPEGTNVLEINPGRVARPLVQQKDGVVSVSDATVLDVGESARAYVDVQNAGAWHKILPDEQTKDSERTSVFVDMDGSPNETQMRDIAKLAEDNGFFAVDTGKGISFINNEFSDIGANRTGQSLSEQLEAGLVDDIEKVTGSPGGQRVKIQTGYEEYESAWAAGEGSRQATEQFFENAERNEAFFNSIEPALRKKARANLARDRERAERTGDAVRPDVMERNRILAEEGYEGLKRAYESGALLPAAILAVLSPALLSSDDDQSRET